MSYFHQTIASLLTCEYLLRTFHERGCSVCKKEVLVAESPKDADAGHARIACRLDINVAVAYIYRPFRRYAELLHSLYYCVGSRLLAYVLTLADGNGHKLVAEEMTAKLLRCRINLLLTTATFLPRRFSSCSSSITPS